MVTDASPKILQDPLQDKMQEGETRSSDARRFVRVRQDAGRFMMLTQDAGRFMMGKYLSDPKFCRSERDDRG